MVTRNLKIIGLLVSTCLYKPIFVWLLTYKKPIFCDDDLFFSLHFSLNGLGSL